MTEMTASERALEELHTTANAIFREALEACNIDSAFDRRIRFEGDTLTRLLPEGSGAATLHLKDYRRILVVAIGKAAVPMMGTLFARMKRRIGVRGICCSPEIPAVKNWRIRYFEGGHPLPSPGSLAAAKATLAMLRRANKETLVIFLISGGSSALFDLPLDAEITLEETMAFHQALIASGAPITEINTVRKHFSAVKGGRLAIAAGEAAKLSILLPDVPLRSLDALGSGPTLPDQTTVEEMRGILEKYDLVTKFPAAVARFFARTDLPESPGNKSRRAAFLARIPWPEGRTLGLRRIGAAEMRSEEAVFRESMYEVLLSSHDLVESARARAEAAGFFTVVDNACDDWDYADAARYLLQRFDAIRKTNPRCCLISGGEVTVTLDRTPGAGGRNMQFALACALELDKNSRNREQLDPTGPKDLTDPTYPTERLVVFSAGSDGIDGNTRAAGAIADTTTIRRAVAFGYKPEAELAGFNACPLFTSLGDTVVTGPTGHNLRDLRLLISGAEEGQVRREG